MEHFRVCRFNLRQRIAMVAHVVIIIPLLLPTPTFGSEALAYEDYCRDFLSGKHDLPSSAPSFLGFHRGGFYGGSPKFDTGHKGFSFRRRRQSALFIPSKNATLANQAGRYLVEGFLYLQNDKRAWNGPIGRPRVFRPDRRSSRDPISQSERRMLNVKGVWIAESGILCMAGCFRNTEIGQNKHQEDCQVKITFQYPTQVSITDPLIIGKVESQRNHSDDPSFFEPIIVTAIPEGPYVVAKKEELPSMFAQQRSDVAANIDVWEDDTAACRFPWYRQPLDVIWNPECRGQNCSPFGLEDHASQTTLLVQNLLCKEGIVHGYFVFSHWGKQGTDVLQNDIFAVEGQWNSSTGQLCMLACHLKGAFNGSETHLSPECNISVTLQFPTTLDLHFRYSVVGHVERSQKSSFSTFAPFTFTGHMDMTSIGWGDRSAPKVVYSYSDDKLRQAQDKCEPGFAGELRDGKKGNQKLKFPNGDIFSDLGFQATLRDSSGLEAVIYFSPISINDRTNRFYNPRAPLVAIDAKRTGILNVSLDLNFGKKKVDVKLVQNSSSLRLSAEGVYNSRTGTLCLIACRTINFSARNTTQQMDFGDQDCQVLVNIKYPPMNPGFFGVHGMRGQIKSLREHKDSLFFEPLSLYSDLHLYQEQAYESILEIDVEIIMGIISLTMAAIFIGLQLRHVKRHPSMLSHVSLLMLSVLIMGHVIPLVLNFEAIFSNRLRQSVLQWSGGWLELYEVVVRLMTMVVFLLLLRLFYLAWGGKHAACATEGPWFVERKILYICLPTYVLGGLITISIHAAMGGIPLKSMKGYAGLIVDLFLFPQVVGNCVWEVQGTILSPLFYFGMTLVRSLPHLYDLMRRFNFVPRQNSRFYYANPNWDMYSNAWDAVLPCGALVLAVTVFFQQRFGGSCALQSRQRQSPTYKEVSTDVS